MQDYDVYVKIITQPFRPMNLPVDYVYRCVDTVARYMINSGAAILCDENGDAIAPSWTPTLVGISANGTAVSIVYDTDMAVTDATGIVVSVDGTPATNTGTAVATDETIAVTLNSAVTAGQVVTVTYDADTGSIANTGAVAALSFNDVVATNATA